MAKDPAFLFYSQDFYTGVATLTFEERGQFITLLSLMHQKGRMSEETIRFLVGSISVNLKSKFRIDENGLWYNERLETEAAKRANFTKTRRDNGSKGGRPKKTKPKGKPKQNLKVNHMANHMEDENENEIIVDNESELLKIEIEKLGEDFAGAWKRWKEYREKLDRFKYHDCKSEKSAITKLGKLAGGNPETAIKIIDQTIDNGWKGFFNLKTNENGKKQGATAQEILDLYGVKH